MTRTRPSSARSTARSSPTASHRGPTTHLQTASTRSRYAPQTGTCWTTRRRRTRGRSTRPRRRRRSAASRAIPRTRRRPPSRFPRTRRPASSADSTAARSRVCISGAQIGPLSRRAAHLLGRCDRPGRQHATRPRPATAGPSTQHRPTRRSPASRATRRTRRLRTFSFSSSETGLELPVQARRRRPSRPAPRARRPARSPTVRTPSRSSRPTRPATATRPRPATAGPSTQHRPTRRSAASRAIPSNKATPHLLVQLERSGLELPVHARRRDVRTLHLGHPDRPARRRYAHLLPSLRPTRPATRIRRQRPTAGRST